MTQMSDQDAVRLLREAVPPVDSAPATIDLWPRVREKVRTPRPPMSAVDWLLIAATVAACVIYPSAAIVPLIHF